MALIAPFPGIFGAGKERERQHKVHLFCAMKIGLPLCAGMKWLLLMKNSGKSNLWVIFSVFYSTLHTLGTVLTNYNFFHIATLWASFEQCFLFCALFQQAPAFLEAVAWALSQGEGMPASASIHFCFRYASFLWSFQINFNASLNFKDYKKTLVLPTLVNWDFFRNPEDAFALVLRVTVSSARIQGVPGTIGVKTSGHFPSTSPGQRVGLSFRCHTPAPHCAWSGSASGAVLSLAPASLCSAGLLEPGLFHGSPAEAGGQCRAWSDK